MYKKTRNRTRFEALERRKSAESGKSFVPFRRPLKLKCGLTPKSVMMLQSRREGEQNCPLLFNPRPPNVIRENKMLLGSLPTTSSYVRRAGGEEVRTRASVIIDFHQFIGNSYILNFTGTCVAWGVPSTFGLV